MPFDSLDKVSRQEQYIATLKQEASKLKEGALNDFYFFGEARDASWTDPVVLIGSVKGPLLTELKAGYKARATGKCFRESKALKLSATTGKMKDTALRKLDKAVKSLSFLIVPGLPEDDTGAEGRADARWKSVMARFDRIKGAITDSDRKGLRILWEEADSARKAGNWDDLLERLAKLDTRITEIGKGALAGEGERKSASREEENARSRWQAVMNRFDKVKGVLSDADRKALRVHWGAAEQALEAEDWEGAYRKLVELDADMRDRAKATLEARKGSADSAGKAIEGEYTADTQKIVEALKTATERLDRLKQALAPDMATLQSLREDLAAEQRKDAPEPDALARIESKVKTTKRRIDAARKEIAAQQKSHDIMARRLEERQRDASGDHLLRLKAMREQIRDLEEMLDSAPLDEAQRELNATVEKMADATVWREAQLRHEAASRDHGTGRHGAQTGLERQARRAATSEGYVDGNRTRYRDGVTPDQPGNAAGTSQQTAQWNKVDLTWTEDANGQRVLKNRRETLQRIVAAGPTSMGGSDTGSMWATPTLEKESFDMASRTANALQKYTHYKRSNGSWGEFKSLVVKLPQPERPNNKQAPGWGYAVKKTDTAKVAEADAEKILKLFEAGKISLDRLFREMNVRLVSEDGGARMIEHATVVFSRSNVSAAWVMKTQYPNDSLSAADVGWEPYSKPPQKLVFKDASDTESELDTSSLSP